MRRAFRQPAKTVLLPTPVHVRHIRGERGRKREKAIRLRFLSGGVSAQTKKDGMRGKSWNRMPPTPPPSLNVCMVAQLALCFHPEGNESAQGCWGRAEAATILKGTDGSALRRRDANDMARIYSLLIKHICRKSVCKSPIQVQICILLNITFRNDFHSARILPLRVCILLNSSQIF